MSASSRSSTPNSYVRLRLSRTWGELERFTKKGRAAIDTHQLVVSPIVQLELTYLHEIERLTVGGADILGDLAARIGLLTSDQSLLSVVQAAASLTWTRDPFDRLIVADALSANCALMTKDEVIRRHASIARW